MVTQENQLSEQDVEIDIGKIFLVLWRKKWLIALVSLIFAAVGAIYAILLTPIYTGNALLQIESKSSGFAGISGLSDAFSGGGAGGETSTELQLMKSRKVLRPTVEKFNMEIEASPKTFPYIGGYFYRKYVKPKRLSDQQYAEPLLGGYFSSSQKYAWGGEKISIGQFDIFKKYYNKTLTVIAIADDKFSLHIDDKEILKGVVGEKHRVAEYGITILIDKLLGRPGSYFSLKRVDQITVIEKLSNDLKVTENGKSSGIIKFSLDGPDKATIKQIMQYILLTYQEQNAKYNAIEAGKSLEFVRDQLPDAKVAMQNAEREIYGYRLNNKTVDLSLQTKQLLDQLLEIEQGLNDLRLSEPEITRKFKKNHPFYLEFLRKRADLEQKRNEVNAQTGNIPTEQFNIYRLQRDVELSQKIYLQTLNRAEELKILKASAIGSVRIIDATEVYPGAIKPRKSIIVILYFMAGLILTILTILANWIFSKKVTNAVQLERFGYEVYATIFNSSNEKKLSNKRQRLSGITILNMMHENDPAIEELRELRTDLHYKADQMGYKIVAITAASKLAGKNFIAQNLASLFALADKRVLLVDVDLRQGNLHERFGVRLKAGFAEYLAGQAEFEDICIKTKIAGLDVICRGATPAHPTELLMGNSLGDFCNQYQKEYDLIIFATAPILSSGDAAIVMKKTDINLMVVRHNYNDVDQLDLVEQKLLRAEVKLNGIIYNDVTEV